MAPGDVTQYGLKHQKPEAPHVRFSLERARSGIASFKIFARNTRSQSLQDFAMELLTLFKEEYPDFALLMEYFVVIPLNSAPRTL